MWKGDASVGRRQKPIETFGRLSGNQKLPLDFHWEITKEPCLCNHEFCWWYHGRATRYGLSRVNFQMSQKCGIWRIFDWSFANRRTFEIVTCKKSSLVLDNSPTIRHNPSLDKRLKVFTQKWPILVKVFTQKKNGTFVKGRGIQQLSTQCPCQVKHSFFSLSRISTKKCSKLDFKKDWQFKSSFGKAEAFCIQCPQTRPPELTALCLCLYLYLHLHLYLQGNINPVSTVNTRVHLSPRTVKDKTFVKTQLLSLVYRCRFVYFCFVWKLT